jgi:P-type E1-E2 ATPase
MKVEAKRSDEIVPGDILYLREGDKVPCDCIVLMGSVLVNENYISGDPYPVRKVELHNFVYISEQEN